MGYIFDTSKGETPETIKRQREIVRALMGAQRAPQNVGEGISALGDGIVANVLGRRADSAEKSGLESANAAMGPLAAMFGGGAAAAGGTPTASSASAAPPSPYAGMADGSKGQEAYAAPAAGGDIEGYIRQAAAARGIDPDVAVRVAKSEGGLSDPFRQADGMLKYGREESYGPFQLHMRMGGVGTRALAEGIDPRKDWKGGIDYALNEAAKKGWGQWYGAAKAGIGNRTGLDRAQALAIQRAQEAAQADPTQVASLDPSIGVPPAANAMQPPTATSPGQEAIAKALLGSPADAQAADLIAKQAANPGAPNISTDTAAFQPPSALPTPAAPAPQQQITQALAQAPQQVAQADVGMGGGQGGGEFPPAPGSRESKIQQLLAAAQNPYLSESQQAIVKALLGEEMQKRDPAYGIDLETKRLQLDQLKGKKQKNWQKLDDDTLFDADSGETKEIGAAPGGDGAFRFKGNSTEAQALNGLMDSGQLTAEQAQQVAAGKTITGPNGEMLFLTPQGIFQKDAQGGPATPVQPQAGGPPPTLPSPDGIKTLTAPKEPTVDEKKAMTFADRMQASGKIIDEMGMRGSGKTDKLLSTVPLVSEYLTTDEFKKVDQAKRDFINAQLRRESGAVISPEEFDNANKQYFPQPNDPPELLEQKRKNREVVVKGMVRDGGPTYKPAEQVAPADDDTPPPPSYTGKFWKFLTPEQRKLWQ